MPTKLKHKPVANVVVPNPAPPEYVAQFRSIIAAFLEATSCVTGNGTPLTTLCQLCIGSGVHGVEGQCGCVCHRARSALSLYCDANSPIQAAQ